ncbi:hypothetical protein TWF718_006008 [Orbilia javanica]|uniref:Uncharacterized protein n=1 Tax=Orbilia javanica TaxID=47235 RepID=A0AAN8MQN5_9PEZI
MPAEKPANATKTPSKTRGKTPKPTSEISAETSAETLVRTPAKKIKVPSRFSARSKTLGLKPSIVEGDSEGFFDKGQSEVEEEVEEMEAEGGDVGEMLKSSKSKSKPKPRTEPRVSSRSSRVNSKKKGRDIRATEKEGLEQGEATERSAKSKAEPEPARLEGVYGRARDLAKAGKIYPSKIAIGPKQPLRNLIAADKEDSRVEATENLKRKASEADTNEAKESRKKKKSEEGESDGVMADDTTVRKLDVDLGSTVDDRSHGEVEAGETGDEASVKKEQKKKKPESRSKSKLKGPPKSKTPSGTATKAPAKGRRYRRMIDRLVEEAKAANFGTKSKEWPASKTLRSGKRYSK